MYTHTNSSFKSSTDGQTYKITQGPLTCNSNNIIYLITCQKCFKQYVGQTCQTLRSRFYHHRFTIHNDRDTPVAKHFNLIDHNIQHLNIIAIDHLPHSDTISRLNKETFWIHTLKTTEPQGLNMNEQSSFLIHLRQSF
ncbi:reverse transcriptase [Plakobranchus ocellatus]|uniref:Reverse transcriptase n=1 Tax=Plakobranchus ocellatus TaxID=259542 RepID=A0AAV3YAU2_9GAST|nr:reverse transcriptase [Plakobranchus ocellatus]